VQFAREEQLRGKSSYEATIAASKTRLRPIVMTSFAFVLGVVPLMLAHGAGAEMRRTLGVAVFAGMLGVTLFGVFLTPVFYHVISTLEGWWHSRHPLKSPSEPNSPSTSPAPSRANDTNGSIPQ
jgi:multidrug efflux pump